MQAIREIKSVSKHQVVVDLPDSFDAKMVEVIIIPYTEPAISIHQGLSLGSKAEESNIMLAQQTSLQDWDNEDDEVWDHVPAI